MGISKLNLLLHSSSIELNVVSYCTKLIACLHDQHKSGFFEGPAFIQPIKAI